MELFSGILPQELSDVFDTPNKAFWIALVIAAATLVIGAVTLGIIGRRRRKKRNSNR